MSRLTCAQTYVRRARQTAAERGNAAVEYALLLPVLIVIVFGAVDFSRAFYAYVTLASTAHEAAIYASRQPAAQVTPAALRTVVARESGGFVQVITTPTAGGNTTITGPTIEGVDEQVAKVTLIYQFEPLVPVPLRGPIAIRAQASAPTGGDGAVPTSTPLATTTAGPAPTSTATPAAGTQPSPTATATPCTVPAFIGTRANDAAASWSQAGFTTSPVLTGSNGNFVIAAQSLSAGTPASCSSSITLTS